MTENRPSFLVVGHLNKVHGTKGELFVWPLTDHPETHFAPGVVHHAGDDDALQPCSSLPPLAIESVRPYRKGFLARFKGCESRAAAETLRGRYLLRPFEAIDPLDEGEVFYHELLGAEVATPGGAAVGTVKEVYPLSTADLIEVAGPDGEVILPLVPQCVVGFDRERRRVIVDPPKGLLPCSASTS